MKEYDSSELSVARDLYSEVVLPSLLEDFQNALNKNEEDEIVTALKEVVFRAGAAFLQTSGIEIDDENDLPITFRAMLNFTIATAVNRLLKKKEVFSDEGIVGYPMAVGLLILKFNEKRDVALQFFYEPNLIVNLMRETRSVATPVFAVDCSKDFEIFGTDDAFIKADNSVFELCYDLSDIRNFIISKDI